MGVHSDVAEPKPAKSAAACAKIICDQEAEVYIKLLGVVKIVFECDCHVGLP